MNKDPVSDLPPISIAKLGSSTINIIPIDLSQTKKSSKFSWWPFGTNKKEDVTLYIVQYNSTLIKVVNHNIAAENVDAIGKVNVIYSECSK